MDFPKFQKLVEERTGFRTMDKPTASGEYFSDSCGDLYNFFLKVGPGAVIEDISYFTTGCGFGTATCSLVVDLAAGKTIDEAAAITTAQVAYPGWTIGRLFGVAPLFRTLQPVSLHAKHCAERLGHHRD